MKKMIRAVWLGLLILIMAGCSSDPSPVLVDEELEASLEESVEEVVEEIVEPEPEAEPEAVIVRPEFGGTLNIAMSPADTLDPLENQVANVEEVLRLIYDPLFDLDDQLAPVPVLVASYSYGLEGRSLLLSLKEGVLFHDGTALTAEDVAYTINTIKDNETSPYNPIVRAIKRVSISDDQTITLFYDAPYAFALNDLMFPIVSKAYRTSEAYDSKLPLGTGAYQFVDYQDMQEMDLTANLNWHGGQVYVEKIHVTLMNETSNMETLFDQHLIDLMNPSKFNWLKYSDKEDQRIESYTTRYYDFIAFNFNNELLQNVNLRKAFNLAIDREAIIYNQFIDHALIAYSPVLPNSWFYTEQEAAESYSIDLAVAQLDQSLYKDGDEDGFYDVGDVLDSGEFKNIELVMLVNNSSSIRTTIAPFIEGHIEALGFEVLVEAVASEVYYERVASGDFDLLYGGWQLSTKPDYSALFATDGSQNYFGYGSEEMDLTLDSIIRAYDQDIIKQRVQDFQVLFQEDMPYISLYFLEGAIMSHSNVYGDLQPNAGASLNQIEALYLDLTEE